jgi:hypothetical protein
MVHFERSHGSRSRARPMVRHGDEPMRAARVAWVGWHLWLTRPQGRWTWTRASALGGVFPQPSRRPAACGPWTDRRCHVPTDGVTSPSHGADPCTSPPHGRLCVDTQADAREIIPAIIGVCQEKSYAVFMHHCHTFVMGVAASSMVS